MDGPSQAWGSRTCSLASGGTELSVCFSSDTVVELRAGEPGPSQGHSQGRGGGRGHMWFGGTQTRGRWHGYPTVGPGTKSEQRQLAKHLWESMSRKQFTKVCSVIPVFQLSLQGATGLSLGSWWAQAHWRDLRTTAQWVWVGPVAATLPPSPRHTQTRPTAPKPSLTLASVRIRQPRAWGRKSYRCSVTSNIY